MDDRLTCPHTALSRYAFIQVLCFGSALSTACRDGNDRVADVYVSHCHLCKSLSREKTILLTRATEERAKTNTFRTHSTQLVPLGVGSYLRRTGQYIRYPANPLNFFNRAPDNATGRDCFLPPSAPRCVLRSPEASQAGSEKRLGRRRDVCASIPLPAQFGFVGADRAVFPETDNRELGIWYAHRDQELLGGLCALVS